jgi:hypothetical protein
VTVIDAASPRIEYVKLTDHARARCAEMGVSTKTVKRALPNCTITYEHHAKKGEWLAHCPDVGLAIAYTAGRKPGVVVVITVLWLSIEENITR